MLDRSETWLDIAFTGLDNFPLVSTLAFYLMTSKCGVGARHGYRPFLATEYIIHRLCKQTWHGALTHGSMVGLHWGRAHTGLLQVRFLCMVAFVFGIPKPYMSCEGFYIFLGCLRFTLIRLALLHTGAEESLSLQHLGLLLAFTWNGVIHESVRSKYEFT